MYKWKFLGNWHLIFSESESWPVFENENENKYQKFPKCYQM